MSTITYTVRRIEDADREKNKQRIAQAQAREDNEWASALRDSFATWENEQGQAKEHPACAICGSTWLTPTRSGTARPHARHDAGLPTWDKVRMLRREIKALQTELDRVLERLEPD